MPFAITLLSVPYNKQLNFTFEALAGAAKTVDSLRDFRARLREAKTEPGSNNSLHETALRALAEFEAGMDDDLNTSVALAAIHNLTREVNTAMARKASRRQQERVAGPTRALRYRAQHFWSRTVKHARQ